MSYFSGIGLRELMDRAGRTVDGERKRARWWQAVALVAIIGALGGPSVVQAVAGTDFAGINIIKDGLEVKVGDLLVDTGRVVVGAPTGPTPIIGGLNAQALSVNGTPVTAGGGTATPLPTCAAGTIYAGPGEPGTTCATPQPTSTPKPNATPQINGVVSTETPAASTILFFPGTQGTPGIFVTRVPTATEVSAPTAFPTLAVNVLIGGTGGQGVQNAGVALSTATPPAGVVPYCSAGGAGCVLSWATPTGGGTSNPALISISTGGTALPGAALNTNYVGLWNDSVGTEADIQFPIAATVTLTKLQVRLTVAPGVGITWTITLRKNGTSTAITCQISGGSATTCADTGHSASFTIGDLVSLLAQGSGGQAATQLMAQAGT